MCNSRNLEQGKATALVIFYLGNSTMKVAIVSNFDLETGRGPVFRLVHILPYIGKVADVVVISLQEPDDTSVKIFKDNKLKYYTVKFKTKGWFVENGMEVAERISNIIVHENVELSILAWEYWDICVCLNEVLDRSGCKFGVVFHSIPFVDALPFPQVYADDIKQRIDGETNSMIKQYLQDKSSDAEKNIRNWNVISISETVTFYLNRYFPSMHFYTACPGYALDVDEVSRVTSEKVKYDFVFMSKLENSKGIFELLSIAEKLRKRRSGIKILVIGDFLYEEEKEIFLSQINEKRLEHVIVFAGWLSGEWKYRELKSGRVFIYPSLTGDTFSFCLLEALACGLEAVCFDTPFARIVYRDAPIRRVSYKDTEKFAEVALEVLDRVGDNKSLEAMDFVKQRYSDWEQVALAEVAAYGKICECKA